MKKLRIFKINDNFVYNNTTNKTNKKKISKCFKFYKDLKYIIMKIILFFIFSEKYL